MRATSPERAKGKGLCYVDGLDSFGPVIVAFVAGSPSWHAQPTLPQNPAALLRANLPHSENRAMIWNRLY